MAQTCETCTHWSDQAPYGRATVFILRECAAPSRQVAFFDMRDDSLRSQPQEGGFFTGPDFGCVRYKRIPAARPEHPSCCSACGETKPSSEFKWVSSGKSTGSNCRACRLAASKQSSLRYAAERKAKKAEAEARRQACDDPPAQDFRGKTYEECGWVFTGAD